MRATTSSSWTRPRAFPLLPSTPWPRRKGWWSRSRPSTTPWRGWRAGLNPRLRLLGILVTMYDGRTLLAQQVEAQLRAHFGEKVFWTVIPRNVRLAEAPSFGKTIAQHAPTSPGAHAYRRLAEEVMARVQEA